MKSTYWNNDGLYQAAADALQALIPDSGEVANPRKNPKLELFRKAVNCYYDLYNNGLCNRARSFAAVYGIASSHYGNYGRGFSPRLYHRVEERLHKIILDAYFEQKISLKMAIA